MSQSIKNFKVALSRNFNEANVQTMSVKAPPAVDTKHVHIYLSRQNSRGSLVPLPNTDYIDVDRSAYAPKSACKLQKPLSLDHTSQQSEPVPVESSLQLDTTGALSAQCTLSLSISPSLPNSYRSTTTTTQRSSPLSPMGALGNAQQAPGVQRRASFLELSVCQVYDYLFMGGVEAAFNAHFLCKSNIEFLVDVTNTEPRDVPRHRKSDVPCVCPRETAHSRARMTITIDEESTEDLTPYFEDVNRFIDSARACGKAVLIYSFHGRNRNAVFVAQYAMKVKGLSCDRAVQLLKEKCPAIAISDNFYRSLRKWDVTLNLISASQAPTVVKRGSPFVRKAAWL
uniref:protein-tyrosine-phosphatase n=1 Tax=Trichuris muris TaxID=70415 RepID=A0A5S6QKI5_TRIMR